MKTLLATIAALALTTGMAQAGQVKIITGNGGTADVSRTCADLKCTTTYSGTGAYGRTVTGSRSVTATGSGSTVTGVVTGPGGTHSRTVIRQRGN